MNLNGKKILIVGATSDIGMVIASHCKQKGAEVLATGRNVNKLLSLNELGIKSEKLDLLCEKEVIDFVESLTIVDGIVFSVGSISFRPFSHENYETIQTKITIGLSAIAALLAKIQKSKRICKNASIVFISSINGVTVGSIGSCIYSAVKAALTGLSKSLALELSTLGIRVNCICPGIIDTPQLHLHFSEETIKRFVDDYPLRRIGSPEDVAKGVAFLLSDDSLWITGTNLIIDGGYSAK